jgi:hypothetical protein
VNISFTQKKNLFFTGYAHRKFTLWKRCGLGLVLMILRTRDKINHANTKDVVGLREALPVRANSKESLSGLLVVAAIRSTAERRPIHRARQPSDKRVGNNTTGRLAWTQLLLRHGIR